MMMNNKKTKERKKERKKEEKKQLRATRDLFFFFFPASTKITTKYLHAVDGVETSADVAGAHARAARRRCHVAAKPASEP